MTSIVWVHGDALSPYNPALRAHPAVPALFVFDDQLLEEYAISLKRIMFIYECLLELPVSIRRGDVAAEVLAFAAEHRAAQVITTPSPSPRFEAIVRTIERVLPVIQVADEPFLDYDGFLDLKRFSRYWRTAQRYV